LGKFGDEKEFAGAGGCKDMKKIGPEEWFETAFNGHPDGLGLEECLEAVAGGGVGEVVGQRANGGEEGLIDARAGGEIGLRGDFGPGTLCSESEDLRVTGILVGRAPGEGLGNADEGMKNDEDRFEEAAIGFDQRDAVRRIGEFFGLHEIGR
jgi:hypothetical protein